MSIDLTKLSPAFLAKNAAALAQQGVSLPGTLKPLPVHPVKLERAERPTFAAVSQRIVTEIPPSVRFTIPGKPMGKPRMTRADKWKKRDCVLRYREWADGARAAAPTDLPKTPFRVDWIAYLPMPASWSKKKREAMTGMHCRAKPDRDNLDKALLDALWSEDSCVAMGSLLKLWDDGAGPRLEVEVWS